MLSAEQHRQVRRISIRARRIVDGAFAGQHPSVFKGQGVEFSEVREYDLGDDVRQIDWNVTARMGRPFVKRQTEERDQTVMLLVDLSRSMHFSSQGRTKLQVAIEIAAMLAHSAMRAHDRVGMVLFTDRVERLVAPRGGRHRTARLVSELITAEPTGTGTGIAQALERLEHAIPRRTITFLLSDMAEPEFQRVLQRVHRRHEVIPVWLRDPVELDLPTAGMVWLRDLETGAPVLVDTAHPAARSEYRRRQEVAQAHRRQAFRSLGVDFVEVFTHQPHAPVLLEFFRRRSRPRVRR